MPDFLERFGMRRSDGELYFSNVRAGLIVAMLSIGTLIGALIGGPIADIIGRKKSIIVWCGIFIVGLIVMITAEHRWYHVMMSRWVQVRCPIICLLEGLMTIIGPRCRRSLPPGTHVHV